MIDNLGTQQQQLQSSLTSPDIHQNQPQGQPQPQNLHIPAMTYIHNSLDYMNNGTGHYPMSGSRDDQLPFVNVRQPRFSKDSGIFIPDSEIHHIRGLNVPAPSQGQFFANFSQSQVVSARSNTNFQPQQIESSDNLPADEDLNEFDTNFFVDNPGIRGNRQFLKDNQEALMAEQGIRDLCPSLHVNLTNNKTIHFKKFGLNSNKRGKLIDQNFQKLKGSWDNLMSKRNEENRNLWFGRWPAEVEKKSQHSMPNRQNAIAQHEQKQRDCEANIRNVLAKLDSDISRISEKKSQMMNLLYSKIPTEESLSFPTKLPYKMQSVGFENYQMGQLIESRGHLNRSSVPHSPQVMKEPTEEIKGFLREEIRSEITAKLPQDQATLKQLHQVFLGEDSSAIGCLSYKLYLTDIPPITNEAFIFNFKRTEQELLETVIVLYLDSSCLTKKVVLSFVKPSQVIADQIFKFLVIGQKESSIDPLSFGIKMQQGMNSHQALKKDSTYKLVVRDYIINQEKLKFEQVYFNTVEPNQNVNSHIVAALARALDSACCTIEQAKGESQACPVSPFLQEAVEFIQSLGNPQSRAGSESRIEEKQKKEDSADVIQQLQEEVLRLRDKISSQVQPKTQSAAATAKQQKKMRPHQTKSQTYFPTHQTSPKKQNSNPNRLDSDDDSESDIDHMIPKASKRPKSKKRKSKISGPRSQNSSFEDGISSHEHTSMEDAGFKMKLSSNNDNDSDDFSSEQLRQKYEQFGQNLAKKKKDYQIAKLLVDQEGLLEEQEEDSDQVESPSLEENSPSESRQGGQRKNKKRPMSQANLCFKDAAQSKEQKPLKNTLKQNNSLMVRRVERNMSYDTNKLKEIGKAVAVPENPSQNINPQKKYFVEEMEDEDEAGDILMQMEDQRQKILTNIQSFIQSSQKKLMMKRRNSRRKVNNQQEAKTDGGIMYESQSECDEARESSCQVVRETLQSLHIKFDSVWLRKMSSKEEKALKDMFKEYQDLLEQQQHFQDFDDINNPNDSQSDENYDDEEEEMEDEDEDPESEQNQDTQQEEEEEDDPETEPQDEVDDPSSSQTSETSHESSESGKEDSSNTGSTPESDRFQQNWPKHKEERKSQFSSNFVSPLLEEGSEDLTDEKDDQLSSKQKSEVAQAPSLADINDSGYDLPSPGQRLMKQDPQVMSLRKHTTMKSVKSVKSRGSNKKWTDLQSEKSGARRKNSIYRTDRVRGLESEYNQYLQKYQGIFVVRSQMFAQQLMKIRETTNLEKTMMEFPNFKKLQKEIQQDEVYKGQKTLIIDIENTFVAQIEVKSKEELNQLKESDPAFLHNYVVIKKSISKKSSKTKKKKEDPLPMDEERCCDYKGTDDCVCDLLIYQIRPYTYDLLRAIQPFFEIVVFSKMHHRILEHIIDHIEAILNKPIREAQRESQAKGKPSRFDRMKKLPDLKIYFQFIIHQRQYIFLKDHDVYIENLLVLTRNRLKENLIFISSNPFRIVTAIKLNFLTIPVVQFELTKTDFQLSLVEHYILKIRHLKDMRKRLRQDFKFLVQKIDNKSVLSKEPQKTSEPGKEEDRNSNIFFDISSMGSFGFKKKKKKPKSPEVEAETAGASSPPKKAVPAKLSYFRQKNESLAEEDDAKGKEVNSSSQSGDQGQSDSEKLSNDLKPPKGGLMTGEFKPISTEQNASEPKASE